MTAHRDSCDNPFDRILNGEQLSVLFINVRIWTLTDGAMTLVARRDTNTGHGGAVELGEAATIDAGAPATALWVVHRVDAIITAHSVEVRAAGEASGAFL